MTTIKALIVGFLAGAATITFALLILKSSALELLTAVLWSIAMVYFGFVLIDGRRREFLIEFGNIVLTTTLALLGLWVAPYWLALGYFGARPLGRLSPPALDSNEDTTLVRTVLHAV